MLIIFKYIWYYNQYTINIIGTSNNKQNISIKNFIEGIII